MIAPVRTKSAHNPLRRSFRPSDLYKVRQLVTDSGEHFPLLVAADTGLPIVRPNWYVLVARRDRCQASTLAKEQGILCIILAWAHHAKVDLHELLDSGKAPDQAQLSGLIDTLRSDFGALSRAATTSIIRPLVAAHTWADRVPASGVRERGSQRGVALSR